MATGTRLGSQQQRRDDHLRSQYDRWAAQYDADTARYGWCAPRRLHEALGRFGPVTPSQRVLDVGVGTGQASLPWREAGAIVVGVDVAPAMLERAAQDPRYHRLAEYSIDAPLESAALPAGAFELVVACGVLHFARDLGATLVQCGRALAPGGRLAFTFVPPQERGFGPKTQVHELAAVRALVEQAGLVVEHEDEFIAYHQGGDQDDPVRYALVVARKASGPRGSA